MERAHLGSQATRDVQAYMEYKAIVGNADGGKMMSEKEYEEFKRKKAKATKGTYGLP